LSPYKQDEPLEKKDNGLLWFSFLIGSLADASSASDIGRVHRRTSTQNQAGRQRMKRCQNYFRGNDCAICIQVMRSEFPPLEMSH
jgi:hypothetical protein